MTPAVLARLGSVIVLVALALGSSFTESAAQGTIPAKTHDARQSVALSNGDQHAPSSTPPSSGGPFL